MLYLTPGAKELLDQHFSEKQETSPIRVFMAPSCGGPSLGLAMDEQKETDDVQQVQNYTFLVDKSLMQTAAPIVIDASPYGFKITSKLSTEGGGCSSCSSCG